MKLFSLLNTPEKMNGEKLEIRKKLLKGARGGSREKEKERK